MYDILWFQDAVDELFELARRDRRQATRVLTTVRSFGRDGRGDIKKLQGQDGEWRLRAGEWRVRILIESRTVRVVSVVPRRDAY